jgi:CheY-like chemotaxis protein
MMYDVVILDINMPGLNGFETCKEICGMFDNNGQIPQQIGLENNSNIQRILSKKPYMVACTAEDKKEIWNKCKDFGFNDIIYPITVDMIKDRIMPHLE